MANTKSGGGKPKLTPEAAAKRFDLVSGDRSPVPPGVSAKMTFAVGGVCLDQLCVRREWRDGIFNHEATSPFGRYNPVSERWQFAPEYVKPTDQARLARLAEGRVEDLRQAGISRLLAGGDSFTDMYHPYTHQIRSELDVILQRWPVADFLARPAVRAAMERSAKAPVVAVDAYTQAYPIIGEHFTHRELKQANSFVKPGEAALPPIALNALIISAADVLLENPDSAGTVRDTCNLLLAKRSPDNPELWVPNRDLELRQADVPVMVDMLTTLAQAQREPGFSVRSCAMTYGDHPYDVTLLPVSADVAAT